MTLNYRYFLTFGYAAALFVPLLPLLVAWLSPPPVQSKPDNALELVGTLLTTLAAAGHAQLVLMLTVAFALLACLGTLCAWWLLRRATGSDAAAAPSALMLWAPVLLAMLGLALAAAIQHGLAAKLQ